VIKAIYFFLFNDKGERMHCRRKEMEELILGGRSNEKNNKNGAGY
jgi:hypothetical protein